MKQERVDFQKMNILIDTNVIVDVLGNREPYIQDSAAILKLAVKGYYTASITANTVTDIYYLIKKHLQSNEEAKKALLSLINIIDVVDVTKNDCIKSLDLPMIDFEDALLAQCAKRIKADYIITRNVKDFLNSPIKPITPKDFLSDLNFESSTQ